VRDEALKREAFVGGAYGWCGAPCEADTPYGWQSHSWDGDSLFGLW
jgi:hypothetical protein